MSTTVAAFEGRHGQYLCQNDSGCAAAGINTSSSKTSRTNSTSGNNKLSPDSPPGTGIFFCHAFASKSENDPEICITRLAELATVACDDIRSWDRVLNTTWKPGKAISKRPRTPRKCRAKIFESLKCAEVEISTEEPHLVDSAEDLQDRVRLQSQEHSNDSSSLKSPKISRECVSATMSSGMLPTTGESSKLSLTGGNQCILKEDAGSASNKGRKKPETRVERYAKTILKFVGERSVPEKLIRLTFGNNPDTSKALRLLLTHRKLNRLGEGGKGFAYIYFATPVGLQEIEEIRSKDRAICLVKEEQGKPNRNTAVVTKPDTLMPVQVGPGFIRSA